MWVPGEAFIPDDLLTALREALAGRYAVLEEIGQGGTATVFRAREEPTGRMVAVKVIDPHLARILGAERFRREITILSRLTHPGILPLLTAGEERDLLYFVMPFITGKTLRQRIEREHQLPMADAVALIRTVLAALEAAHRANIVHRDIKPENILLQDGRPIVADFGIARAIERAGGDTLSSTGFAVGTPTYMSPEQAAGERQIDGRSDIYSTACVLYELLAGGPPFSGPTPRALQARHIHERPPSLRIVRPDLPPALEAVIEKALAKAPAARFGTAQAFADALAQAMDPRNTTPVAPLRRKRWMVGAAVVVLLGLLGGTGWWVVDGGAGAGVDPNKYVVLPFRQVDSGSSVALSGDESARLLTNALLRYDDAAGHEEFSIVDPLVVGDRLDRDGVPRSVTEAIAMARVLGAGRLIWGEHQLVVDSVRVRAAVYPVGGRRHDPIARKDLALSRSEVPADGSPTAEMLRKFASLATRLVFPTMPQTDDAEVYTATTSFSAVSAALTGDSALSHWNLPLAKEEYRKAFTIDPAYSPPRLRFARAAMWADDPVTDWAPQAEAALQSPQGLNKMEQLEAAALVALGRGDFPTACDQFRRILSLDSLRFAGWFGLGECQTQDSIVVPDPASSSKFRFRGSYAAGIAAYRRALTLVPLAHLAFNGAAIDRLAEKLMASPNQMRGGVHSGDPARRFAAFPGWAGDSLSFIPYTLNEVLAGQHTPLLSSKALTENRNILLGITSEWLARYPGSVAAIRSHAWALEVAGRIASAAADGPGALKLVHRLRAMEQAGKREIALVAWETRLLLKSSRFAEARELADSGMMLGPQNSNDGQTLAALAALTGRIFQSADLMERYPATVYVTPAGEVVTLPMSVAADASRLLVFAAAGQPVDSIRAVAERVRQKITAATEPGKRDVALRAALFRPSLLAYPVLPPPTGHQLLVMTAEQALARESRASAVNALTELEGFSSATISNGYPVDLALLEARLYALAADTAAARARLETIFGSWHALRMDVLDDLSQAVAIGRAMITYQTLGGEARRPGLDTASAQLLRIAYDDSFKSNAK